MGLCKCPVKKVTNQFCFEHRVNVCESCMVTDHSKCIVQSYLHWLDDSDYNPVCKICQDKLASDECIRLVCYDVFHKECLNTWAQKLPAHTAPAGYKCPVCSKEVFPSANHDSPVAHALKDVLAQWPWARVGLDLPLLEDEQNADWSLVNGSNSNPDTTDKSSLSLPTKPAPTHYTRLEEEDSVHALPPKKESTPRLPESTISKTSSNFVPAVADTPVVPSQFHSDGIGMSGISRKPSSSDAIVNLPEDTDTDTDENKYKRRSAVDWFSRWWRTMHRPSSRHHQSLLGGHKRMIALLVVLGVISIFVILSYLSQGRADDPSLDPFNNPNIRVQEEE